MPPSPHTFPELLQRFFAEHLTAQRNLSPHTIAAYRDCFRLLLRFLSAHLCVTIDRLTLESLTPDTILVFLAHLEDSRNNVPRTRNSRLAAIRAFTRYVISLAEPGAFVSGHRLLAIPVKRSIRPLLGYLSCAEIEALLSASNLATWIGRRDHLLFLLLHNTGARISEALALRSEDIQNRVVRLHGKPERPNHGRSVGVFCERMRAIRPVWTLLPTLGQAPMISCSSSAQPANFSSAEM